MQEEALMDCHAILESPIEFAKIEMFKSVLLPELADSLHDCERKKVSAGTVLLSPEQGNQHIYILLSGALRVHINTLDSPPLNFIKPGECVGEMSIIDQLQPSAYVVAEEESCLLSLPQKVLWSIIDTSPLVARNLLYILTRRLRHEHNVLADSVERQKRWQQDASIDVLTGIHNRRWFDEIIKKRIQEHLQVDAPLCLLLVDIDHFKSFNDQFGHLMGDRVLCNVASRLKTHLRKQDLLARFGGDEFIIALPHTLMDSAIEVAKRIKAEAGQLLGHDDEKQALPTVTLTLGLASLKPEDSFQSLFERADCALYEAKNKGRNCVECADEETRF